MTNLLDAALEQVLPLIRKKKSGERFEQKDDNFFARIHQGYHSLKNFADFVVPYDSGGIERMQSQIRGAVESRLEEKQTIQNP